MNYQLDIIYIPQEVGLSMNYYEWQADDYAFRLTDA